MNGFYELLIGNWKNGIDFNDLDYFLDHQGEAQC